jgi:DNA-binding CsgD family transcriptional regulator
MNTTYDTSGELLITRCGHGVKLMRPEQYDLRTARQTVADIMSLPLNVFFLDRDSISLNLNEPSAEAQKFTSVNDAIGKSVRDVLDRETAAIIAAQDRLILETRLPQFSDDFGRRTDEVDIQGVTVKFPWYGAGNQLLGVFGLTIMQGSYARIPLAQGLTLIMQTGLLGQPEGKKLLSREQINGVSLSRSEARVLELVVRGKSAREIAVILRRSPRTIEHHIENIRDKTHSASKSELIEKYFASSS